MPKIDLETFAKDHNKEKEGIKFEADMNALSKELENLDEGKYYPLNNNIMGSPASQKITASFLGSKFNFGASKLIQYYEI